MAERDWDDHRRAFFDQLAVPDAHAGAHIVEGLIAAGATLESVVREVLRPAQIEVGRRWQVNEWSVADEHAASAVTEAALMAASASTSTAARSQTRHVVLACADGEWHTLPLRMVSEVVSEAGFQSVFLGPSVPPDHLRAYLAKAVPVALALSCSSPLSLEGARDSIEAAHAAGVPVLAGGRGFGSDAHRAVQAGADAWTDDPAEAIEILRTWAIAAPGFLGVGAALNGEASLGDQEQLTLRQRVVSALREEFPILAGYTDQQWSRTLEDIDFMVRFALLAVRWSDDRVFSDFVGWLREVLTARHVPAVVLSSSLAAVADALQSRHPEVTACIRRAAATQVFQPRFGTIASPGKVGTHE